MTHILQVRDLVEDLKRHRQEAPVVFVSGSHEFNFDKSRKTHLGVVELRGLESDALTKQQEDYNALEELEAKATSLLEDFARIMSGEVATNPKDYNDALDKLHEEVETHLKNR